MAMVRGGGGGGGGGADHVIVVDNGLTKPRPSQALQRRPTGGGGGGGGGGLRVDCGLWRLLLSLLSLSSSSPPLLGLLRLRRVFQRLPSPSQWGHTV